MSIFETVRHMAATCAAILVARVADAEEDRARDLRARADRATRYAEQIRGLGTALLLGPDTGDGDEPRDITDEPGAVSYSKPETATCDAADDDDTADDD